MSERKVREAAITRALDSSWVCVCCRAYADERTEIEHESFCSLSEPPDAEKILRFVSGNWRRVPRWSETAGAFETVIDYINEHFGRLTDDGWEWVKDD